MMRTLFCWSKRWRTVFWLLRKLGAFAQYERIQNYYAVSYTLGSVRLFDMRTLRAL
jgi:hypothetical protein